jgi:hypothetical protein
MMKHRDLVEAAVIGFGVYCLGLLLLLVLPKTIAIYEYPDIVGTFVALVASALCLGGVTIFADAGFSYINRGVKNANPQR